jgi:hypothetical protein
MRGAVPLLPKAGKGIGGLYLTYNSRKKFKK